MKRFNRFELKYLVTADQAAAVRQDLTAHMTQDSHGQSGSYAVTSLYYDTADLAFLRAKQEGIKYRRKLRVRRYASDPTSPVWVEIKQRINRTTQKRRLALPEAQALRLCAGDRPQDIDDPSDDEAAQEVEFLVGSLGLQPTCVIGYRREAWVGGNYEPGLRVTFDRDLWTTPAAEGLEPTGRRQSLIPPIGIVMEVKANERVPLWLATLLARHQCPLRRYSKYCNGVARLAELSLLCVPDPERV